MWSKYTEVKVLIGQFAYSSSMSWDAGSSNIKFGTVIFVAWLAQGAFRSECSVGGVSSKKIWPRAQGSSNQIPENWYPELPVCSERSWGLSACLCYNTDTEEH